MSKANPMIESQLFATTVGVLIVVAIFGAAIGGALFVQNEQKGHQGIWPFASLSSK
jgi:hypothetical protein